MIWRRACQGGLGSLAGVAMYFAEKLTILSRSPVVQCALIGGVHGDDLDLNRPGPVTLRAGDQPRGAAPQTNLFEVDGKPASRAYMGAVPHFPFLCFLQGTTPEKDSQAYRLKPPPSPRAGRRGISSYHAGKERGLLSILSPSANLATVSFLGTCTLDLYCIVWNSPFLPEEVKSSLKSLHDLSLGKFSFSSTQYQSEKCLFQGATTRWCARHMRQLFAVVASNLRDHEEGYLCALESLPGENKRCIVSGSFSLPVSILVKTF